MRELIKRLIEQRAQVWEKAKVVLDLAQAETRDLSTEEQTAFDTINTEITALDVRIDELTEIEKRVKASDEQRAEYADDLNNGGDARDTSDEVTVADQFRQLAAGELRSFELSMTGLETFVTREGMVEVRDLGSGTGAAGGDTIPTSFRRQLYEHMIENSAIRQTNVTVLRTASGESLELPKTLTHSGNVTTVTAEGAAIAEDDPTFDKVALGAFKYGIVTQVPFELLTDTGVDLEGYLSRQMGRALANGTGTHLVTGDGSGKPNGVVTASTLGVTGAAAVAGAFTADELIDLEYSVIDAYARNAWWLMRRATEGKARKLKGSDNNYLWQPGLQIGTPNQLLGRPVVTDPNVAAVALSAKSVLFGDFSSYVIREVGGVAIRRSDDFAFTSDLATFKATVRIDGDLQDLTGAIKHFIGNAA